MMRGMMFSGKAKPGQVEFRHSLNTQDFESVDWVVPAGVTSICVVTVQRGAGSDSTGISRGATVLLNGATPLGNGVGGGNGGAPGVAQGGGAPLGRAGAGGAGGYLGNGGDGGDTVSSPTPGSYEGRSGTAGAGGGGGGGAGAYGTSSDPRTGGFGGGVGLKGVGASGAGGVAVVGQAGQPGGNGSQSGEDFYYGRGITIPDRGSYHGGNLRFKNDIPVSPGETLKISLSYGAFLYSYSRYSNCGVRIIWGEGRSFPYNAQDV